MEIKIEQPKETYDEIGELIHSYYRTTGGDIFDVKNNSFARKYPQLYKLYLSIAAIGLHK